MKNFWFIFFIFFLCFPGRALAGNMFDVVFNEIAWMGTTVSANDEWIELKNNTGSEINMTGWTLQTADEKIKINLQGAIPANGFYFLERTDNNTVPNIKSDHIYSGSLSNNGQDLWLYDTQNNIIDEADFYQGWEFGNNATKQTMERLDNENWQTSKDPGGTPGKENSVLSVIPGLTRNPESDQENVDSRFRGNDTNDAPKTYPGGIMFSRILPSPEGSDETEEWIEIKNTNNFVADLSGWQIKDFVGTSTSFKITENKSIEAYGMLKFFRPETKIVLNNDGDKLELFSPDGKLADSLNFGKAPTGAIYAKFDSGWQWLANSADISAIKTNNQVLPKEEKTVNIDNRTALAGLSQTKNSNPWFLFFSALSITLISAVSVLIIKLKLKNNVRT